MEIEITPSSFTGLCDCPRQFDLRYRRRAIFTSQREIDEDRLSRYAELVLYRLLECDYAEELDKALFWALGEVKGGVSAEDVKIVRGWAGKWLKRARKEDSYDVILRDFELGGEDEGYLIGGKIPKASLKDGRVEIVLLKCNEKKYTEHDLRNSHEPILYAMGLLGQVDENCEKVVVIYDMVRYGEQVSIQLSKDDVEWRYEKFKVELRKMLKWKDDYVVIGRQCASCYFKGNCREYKLFLVESFDAMEYGELMVKGIDEVLEYVKVLELRKYLIKKELGQIKNLMMNEILASGRERVEHGKYSLYVVRRDNTDYDVNEIVANTDVDLNRILQVKRKEFGEYMENGMGDEARAKIMASGKYQEQKPFLLIKDGQSGEEDEVFDYKVVKEVLRL